MNRNVPPSYNRWIPIHPFVVFSVVAVCILWASHADARYDPRWKWHTVKNDHFTVYYPEGHEAFAARILSLTSEVHDDVTGYFGIEPRRCSVVLNPGTDVLNGFYSLLPNRISLFETPGSSIRGFGGASDIVDLVFTHEYTHFVHITTRLGLYGAMTRIIGDGAAVSNGLSPLWVIEGVTTNTETLFTDGGRGRCPYFRGIMMSFTEGGDFWSLNDAGASSAYAPPAGRFYLAGYHMIEYMTRNYGDDAVARLNRRQGLKPLGGTSRALRKTTGVSPKEFYRGFREEYLAGAERHRKAVDADRLPSGTVVAASPRDDYSSIFWTERGSLIAFRTGYDRRNALVEFDPVTGKIASETAVGAMYPFMPITRTHDGKIVYGGIFLHPLAEGELDTADLVVYDPAEKSHTRLTHDAHIYSACLSPDGKTFVAVCRNGMWTELVLLDSDGGSIRTLVSQPGLTFEGPVWSPDGFSIAVAVKSGRKSDIVSVDPGNGGITTLFAADDYEDLEPSFSPDGRWILFSSNRSGVWNIHAWDTRGKSLYQLTSVYYNAGEPEVSPDGSTLAFTSMYRGINRVCTLPFEPTLGRKVVVGEGDSLPAPDLARLQPDVTFKGEGIPLMEAYRPFIHSPWFSSDEKGTQAGLFFMGGDPVGINAYNASILYGLDSGRWGYDVSLTNRSRWPTLGARVYDRADLGNTLGGHNWWYRERGGEVSIGSQIINSISPEMSVSSFTLGSRIRSFDLLENIPFKPGGKRTLSVFAGFSYVNSHDSAVRDMVGNRSSSVSIFHEESVRWSGYDIEGHNTLIRIGLTVPSPLRHHGFMFGAVHQNQAGNIWYDRYGSLPRGYASDTGSGGLRFGKTLLFSAEYHFPIAFPDAGFGMMAYHLDLLKAAWFYDYGGGWMGDINHDAFTSGARSSCGLTLSAQSVIFHLPLDISLQFGYKIKESETFTHFFLVPRI